MDYFRVRITMPWIISSISFISYPTYAKQVQDNKISGISKTIDLSSVFSKINAINIGADICQDTFDSANPCSIASAMRALTVSEVLLLVGTNSTSHGGVASHGSCNSAGCTVSASAPPSLPPSAPPPSSGNPGAGGDGGTTTPPPTPPTKQQQEKDEKCAAAYGNLAGNPSYGGINFTTLWGWSANNAQGAIVDHTTTSTSQPPNQAPGNGATTGWHYVSGSTYVDSAPQHTDIYEQAYTLPQYVPAYEQQQYLVRDIAHEWYHQNYDYPGESDAVRAANENAATTYGNKVKDAYLKDKGSKC